VPALAGEVVAQSETRRIKNQMSPPVMLPCHELETILPRGTPQLRLGYALPQGPFWFQLTTANAENILGRKPGT